MSSVSPHALEGTALIVHVIKARGLSGAPLVVKQRPYVVLRLGCVEYATNSAKRGLRRHVWDEKFSLPLQTSRDALEVSCFSSHVTKNTSGSHLIGRGTVHVSTVSKKEGGHNAWVKLDNGGEVLLDITRPAHPPLPPSVPRPRPISFPSIMPMMQSYKRLHSEIGSWNSVKSPPCKRSRLSLETSRPAIWRTSFRPNAPINTDQQSSFPSAIGAGPSKSSTSLGRESPPLDADDNAGVAYATAGPSGSRDPSRTPWKAPLTINALAI
ncbi:hypothetical protein PLICRDRAFT_29110 [Plicaturopsis crispa FD-325 SS-3]|nr:hypothetical protein PLICRDRAFT_29110 [Plicaturopsis crispa FD-325 SS-3]